MQVTVYKEVDYITEAILVLNIISENKSWEEYRSKIVKRVEIEDKDFIRKLKLIQKLIEELQSKIAYSKEDIKFYFGNLSKYDVIPAELILCRGAINQLDMKSMSEIKEKIVGFSDELRDECFIQHFNFDSEVYDFIMGTQESPQESVVRTKRLVQHLFSLPIEEKDRNIIISSYFDEEYKHLNKVVEIMEQAITILKIFDNELAIEAEAFYQYWIKKLDQIDMYEDIFKPLGIETSFIAKEILLIPGIINASALGFYCDVKARRIAQDTIHIKMGILFSDTFWIASLFDDRFDKEDIYQTLKLLGDKSKFDILTYIKDKPAYGAEIAKEFNLTTPTISHHVNSLLKQGLVKIETSENRIYYTSNKENIQKIVERVKELLL